jgi:predicted CoA-binding protein
MADLQKTLEEAETVAVMGCSDKPHRTSHKIASYLKESGYRVLPVNPNVEKACGERAYPDLASIPKDVRIDIVDIFRDPEHTAEMVEQAARRAEQTGERPTVWTQLGVSSSEAERAAKDADLPYVKNRCMMVEHGRLIGSPEREDKRVER